MILNPHKRRRKFPKPSTHRKSSFVGATALLLAFYTALILGSSCVHADVNPETPSHVSWSVAGHTADDHADESLCRSVHEHALRAVAVSDHSEIVSVSPALLFAAHNMPTLNDVTSDAFRPPGSGFSHPHSSFQLSTVLRI